MTWFSPNRPWHRMILSNIVGTCWHFFCTKAEDAARSFNCRFFHLQMRQPLERMTSDKLKHCFPQHCTMITGFKHKLLQAYKPCSSNLMLNSATLHVLNDACVVSMLVAASTPSSTPPQWYQTCVNRLNHGFWRVYANPPSLSLAFPALQSPKLAFENIRTC